ncbi:N-carbamyl-L-amino acid hydrolase [Hyaloraphidium curvatum]|nr:N-carbamyl-L-amino acid hydrolase [Hyaloraphidium curvatum]
MTKVKVNVDRLWNDIIHTGTEFGGTAKGGVNRGTFTENDKKVRDWFVAQGRKLGAKVSWDELGNIYIRRDGRNASLPPIAIGSHLDTQFTGGKFDGILGVLSGLEVLRALEDAGYRTEAPIEVIDWTNEEGCRFPPAMLSSGVFGGVFTTEYAYSREDRQGNKFGEELERIGYKGSEKCDGRAHRLAGHFELHIEQGPILEDEKLPIGIVTGVQSIRWYEVTLNGQASHAGTTPMHLRRDTLLAASRMVNEINQVALKTHPLARSTVGVFEVSPGSINTVPEKVFFSVDLRHEDDAVVEKMEGMVRELVERIAKDVKLFDFKFERIWESPAVKFAPSILDSIETSVKSIGLPYKRMVSGAGHDSVYTSRVCNTGMIFIPCRNGISHNEIEFAEKEHVGAGAAVLLGAVLEYDKLLAAKGKL